MNGQGGSTDTMSMVLINYDVAGNADKDGVLQQCYSHVGISGNIDGAGEQPEQEMLSNRGTWRNRDCSTRTCTSLLLWWFFF